MTLIAIQGITGSYSYEAARRIAGDDAEILECSDFASAVQAVVDGKVKFAVVPVFNKIVGTIKLPDKLIKDNELQVQEELRLPIEHILAGLAASSIDQVKTIRSHIEALKQCKKFLNDHPKWEIEQGNDTAGSLRSLIENNEQTTAAICSKQAAKHFNARILEENIADEKDNWTVFQLVGKNNTRK